MNKFIILIDKWYQHYLNHKWHRALYHIMFFLLIFLNITSSHYLKALLFFLIYVIWRKWFVFPYRKQNILTMVMGAPGNGKTSFLCYLSLRANNLGEDVYSNVAIKNTYKFSWSEDFGNYLIEDATLLIDEVALEDGLNNREFATNFSRKNGTFRKLECLKLHRHFKIQGYLFSQADDADSKARELCQQFYICKKIFPWLIMLKNYTTDIDLDPMTQDFRKVRIKKHSYFLFTPVCWRYFDTEEVPFDLKIKDFVLR